MRTPAPQPLHSWLRPAPPLPSCPQPVGPAVYSGFSYWVINNLPQYTTAVQSSVGAQLAAQVGVPAAQVSLTTPYFPVASLVTMTGLPTGYESAAQQGLVLYLGVSPSAANITVVSSSSAAAGGRRRCGGGGAVLCGLVASATALQGGG